MTDVVDDDPPAIRPRGGKGLHRSSTTRSGRAGTRRSPRSLDDDPTADDPTADDPTADDPTADDATDEVLAAEVDADLPFADDPQDAPISPAAVIGEPTMETSIVPMARRAAGRVPMPRIGLPEDGHSWLDQEAGPVVRPYTLTGGRSRPFTSGLELLTHVEALYAPDADLINLQPEHRAILTMTRTALSMAEIAARLDLPVGVVRVLVGDLLQADLVSTFEANAAFRTPDDEILLAVINGLRAL